MMDLIIFFIEMRKFLFWWCFYPVPKPSRTNRLPGNDYNIMSVPNVCMKQLQVLWTYLVFYVGRFYRLFLLLSGKDRWLLRRARHFFCRNIDKLVNSVIRSGPMSCVQLNEYYFNKQLKNCICVVLFFCWILHILV